MDNGTSEKPQQRVQQSALELQNRIDAYNKESVRDGNATPLEKTHISQKQFAHEKTNISDIQQISKRIAFWIAAFGWLYVFYWLCDTVVVIAGENSISSYLYFCIRGVLGVSFIVLARKIKKTPSNIVTFLNITCGLLLLRALTLSGDKEFGTFHLSEWIYGGRNISSPPAFGMGPIMLLLLYIWGRRRVFVSRISETPNLFDMIKPQKDSHCKPKRWKFTILFSLLVAIFLLILFLAFIDLADKTPSAITSQYSVQVAQKTTEEIKTIPDEWVKYTIGNLATIVIPPSMELRNKDGQHAEIVAGIKATVGSTTQIDMGKNTIVFQQAGLDSLSGKSRQRYARIMINIFEDTDNFGEDLATGLSGTREKKLDTQYRKQVVSDMGKMSEALGVEVELIAWHPTVFGEMNHIPCYKQSFERQMGKNPIVHVTGYQFFGQKKIVEIIFSHRVNETDYFKKEFKGIADTFRFQKQTSVDNKTTAEGNRFTDYEDEEKPEASSGFELLFKKACLDVATNGTFTFPEQQGQLIQTPPSAIKALNMSWSGKQDSITGLKPFQIEKALSGLATMMNVTRWQDPKFVEEFLGDTIVIVGNAMRGDPWAQLNVALMYEYGQGVPQDNDTSCQWHNLRAYNDKSPKEAKAYYADILAGIYCFPFGKQSTHRDYPEAYRLWLSAAEQGHSRSAGCIGWCYYLGQGVSKNSIEALSWFYVAKGLDTGALSDFDTLDSIIGDNDWATVIERVEKVIGAPGTLVAQERADVINRRIHKGK